MKAVVIYKHGEPEVLEMTELSTPQPGPGEVLVRVQACALNHLDLWVRRGIPSLKLSYPHILGSDVAGIIHEVGDGVSLEVGQKALISPGLSCGKCKECLSGRDNLCRYYGILGEHLNGGYAEFVKVPMQNILPYPEPLSFEEAACLPLVFLTGWQMVFRKAKVKAGEWVLVMAAGSGVSTAIIQLLKLSGTIVIAAAGSEDKLNRARELGADFTINYRQTDYLEEVKRITHRRGVDVVFDHTGAENWNKSLACLTWGGRFVTCGATSGYSVPLDLRHVYYRQLSILGSTMGSKGDLFHIVQLAMDRKIKPVLYRILPLKEAAEAHRILENREVIGKVVLKISDS